LLNYTCQVGGTPAVKLNEEAQEFRWVAPHAARAMPLNTPTRILLEAVLAGDRRANEGARMPGLGE
jgi:hypothetical protein